MNDPRPIDLLAGASGCVIWVPIAIWVVGLVHWMIGGEIDPVVGILGIGVAFAMGYLALRPPVEYLPPILLIGSIVTIVLFPMAVGFSKQSEMRSIDLDAIDKAYVSIAERGESESSLWRLAKSLYTLGYLGHAVAVGSRAMQNGDRRFFRDELAQLERWRAAMAGERMVAPSPLVCLKCGLDNDPSLALCQRCGNHLYVSYVRGRWMAPELKSKLLAVWTALAICAVLIPVTLVSLSGMLAIVVIILSVLLSALTLVRAFRRGEAA